MDWWNFPQWGAVSLPIQHRSTPSCAYSRTFFFGEPKGLSLSFCFNAIESTMWRDQVESYSLFFVGKEQKEQNKQMLDVEDSPRDHEGCCYRYHSELRSRNQRAGYWGPDKGGQGLCSWISSGFRRGSQSRSPGFIKEEFNTAEQISQQLADHTWTIASYAGLLSLLILWVNNKVNLVRVTGSEQGQFRSICPWRVWFLLLQISWSEPELMAPSLVHLLDKCEYPDLIPGTHLKSMI